MFRIDVHTDQNTIAPLTLPTDTQLLALAIGDNDVVLLILDPGYRG